MKMLSVALVSMAVGCAGQSMGVTQPEPELSAGDLLPAADAGPSAFAVVYEQVIVGGGCTARGCHDDSCAGYLALPT
jgi:hypothetical protein